MMAIGYLNVTFKHKKNWREEDQKVSWIVDVFGERVPQDCRKMTGFVSYLVGTVHNFRVKQITPIGVSWITKSLFSHEFWYLAPKRHIYLVRIALRVRRSTARPLARLFEREDKAFIRLAKKSARLRSYMLVWLPTVYLERPCNTTQTKCWRCGFLHCHQAHSWKDAEWAIFKTWSRQKSNKQSIVHGWHFTSL